MEKEYILYNEKIKENNEIHIFLNCINQKD